MSTYALTGNDSLILNSRVLKDYTDGSTVEIAYQNDRVGLTTGKNANTVYSTNKQGLNATLTIRVIRGSSDDKWLNRLSTQQEKDLPTFTLLNGSFSKRVGDGNGRVTFDEYVLLGGVFQRYADVQENLQGDTEQGTAVYTLVFAQVKRALS